MLVLDYGGYMKRAKKKRPVTAARKKPKKPVTTADKIALAGLIIPVVLWILDRLLDG